MDERAVLKDQDVQRHYDALFDLFATPGWKVFVADVMRIRDGVTVDGGRHAGVNDIRRLLDEKGLYFAKGQLEILDWLDRYADATRNAYDQLLAEENADAAARDD